MAIDPEKGVRAVTVGDVLAEELLIPPYQRPYSWEPATALQLLDDIREAYRSQAETIERDEAVPSAKKSYVLGAVILHKDRETGETNVVDGQQRLLTLLMILRILGGDMDGSAPDEDATSPVVLVRRALAHRVKHIDVDCGGLADFIHANCEVIRVETDDPDEAFRVFDSQNYRGKALLPHDLLKAYHLREMRGETASMQSAIVEGWESVPDAELDRLFSAYLWRIQRWSRGMPAPPFTARHVDAFKGLTVRSASTPSARYHLAAQVAVPMLSAWSTGQSDDADRNGGRGRFQLDAPILAGPTFFAMVTFMLKELKRLRSDGFKKDGWQTFASTDDQFRELASRSRYRYVSELYLAALLYYTNKFGDTDVREATERLFKWAFSLRTSHQRVQFATVNNHASAVGAEPSAFVLLRNAGAAADLRRLSTEVKGRDQDSEHEKDLLRLLSGLGG